MERNAIVGGDGFQIGVIGDDTPQVAGKFAHFPSGQEVDKTVLDFRHEKGETRLRLDHGNGDVHPEISDKAGKPFPVGGCFAAGLPFDSLEKDARLLVPVLVGMEDVAAALVNPVGGAGDKARLVRTMKKGDKGARTRFSRGHD